MAEVLEKDEVSHAVGTVLRIRLTDEYAHCALIGSGVCEHDGCQAQHDFNNFTGTL